MVPAFTVSGADVTVYFTGNDDVLPISLYTYEYNYHDPEFGSRLGSAGPLYNIGALRLMCTPSTAAR